jgi:hypothetical protein
MFWTPDLLGYRQSSVDIQRKISFKRKNAAVVVSTKGTIVRESESRVSRRVE